MRINIPRFTAITPEEQIEELKKALVKVVNESNAEIQRLERKIIKTGGNTNNGL